MSKVELYLILLVAGICFSFVWLPVGEFFIGCSAGVSMSVFCRPKNGQVHS